MRLEAILFAVLSGEWLKLADIYVDEHAYLFDGWLAHDPLFWETCTFQPTRWLQVSSSASVYRDVVTIVPIIWSSTLLPSIYGVICCICVYGFKGTPILKAFHHDLLIDSYKEAS